MKALVIGATGATGKDLVNLLLEDASFERVDVFVRREVEASSPRLKVHVVDFDHIGDWAHLLTGDVLFSCLGTTIRAAKSRDAQEKVDFTYQLESAREARRNGVPRYVLVSSIGANPKSKVFYTKMKGRLDEEVTKLGFPGCFILRPPSLVRKDSDRFGEKVSVAVLKGLNRIGLLRSLRPMDTEELAAAMVALAKERGEGTRIIESQDILDIIPAR